jgi:hypothetical protein
MALRYIEKTNKTSIEIRGLGIYEIETPLDIAQYCDKLKEVVAKYI